MKKEGGYCEDRRGERSGRERNIKRISLASANQGLVKVNLARYCSLQHFELDTKGDQILFLNAQRA